MSRFLIVEDHPLFREALQAAVGATFPGAEVFEATAIAPAVEMIEEEGGGFDLVLLDLSLPGTRGFEGLIELRRRFPAVPVMIVSSLEERGVVTQAFALGASGFVAKSARKAEIASALVAIMNGAVYPPEGSGEAAAEVSAGGLNARLASLTPQQFRVLQMLQQGLLNKQIAYELAVSEATVKAHVSEVLRKLGVNSRTQAVIEMAKSGFNDLRQGDG